MKEAFWGALIVILGLFGIVVVNIFQNVTIDNDRVYYLIKESTEASAFDALDLTYYRLTGNLRIVEDKFVENLTRRFAENVTIGDYTIVVEDVNEMPPKVSLRVRSGITSLMGEEFGIVNRVDGILELKYNLEEVLEFLDITEEEWNERTQVEEEVNGEGKNVCDVITSGEGALECMPGDLMFTGFSDVSVKNSVCYGEVINEPKDRNVNYKECNCGVWEEKNEKVTATPVKIGNEYVYTWTFNKNGEVHSINETIKSRVLVEVCTTDIGIMVPKEIESTLPRSDGKSYEPSSNNSDYMTCPVGGIKIPVGMKFTLHPNYIPPKAVNRNLEWTVSDSNILGIQSSNPRVGCAINENGTNCFSKSIVTAKKVGTTYVNVKTTLGQTSTCKIEVFDGNVDAIGCEDLSVALNQSGVMSVAYNPKNATKTNFTWSISDSSIATIDKDTGTVSAKKSGAATVTVKSENGKTGTCNIVVPSGASSNSGAGGGYYRVYNPKTKENEYFWNYEEAQKAAREIAHSGKEGADTFIYLKTPYNSHEIVESNIVMTKKSGNTLFEEESVQSQYYIKGKAYVTQVDRFVTTGGKTIITSYTRDENNRASNYTTTYVAAAGGNAVDVYTGSTQSAFMNYVDNYKITSDCGGGACTSCYSNRCLACSPTHDLVNGVCVKKKDSSDIYVGFSDLINNSNNSSPQIANKDVVVEQQQPSGGSTITCLDKDTKVLTTKGYKSIKNIKVGDFVLSYNFELNRNEYKKVSVVYKHKNIADELYTITVNHKKIKATKVHDFYVKTSSGYKLVMAKDLKVGDMLMSSNGKYYPITKISRKFVLSNYYDITVDDNHNFYVGKNGVLGHNRVLIKGHI